MVNAHEMKRKLSKLLADQGSSVSQFSYLFSILPSGHFIKVRSRLFPNNFFSIYDNLTSEHVPGQLKYDVEAF